MCKIPVLEHHNMKHSNKWGRVTEALLKALSCSVHTPEGHLDSTIFPVWTTEGCCETQQTSPGKDGISNSRFTLMDDSELKGKIKNNNTVWEVEVSISTEQTNHRCWSEGSHQIALTSRVFMRNLWFNSRTWTSLLGLVVHKCVHNTHNKKFWSPRA